MGDSIGTINVSAAVVNVNGGIGNGNSTIPGTNPTGNKEIWLPESVKRKIRHLCARKNDTGLCKKYEPYILKYKALILKYVPCIFCDKPYVFYACAMTTLKVSNRRHQNRWQHDDFPPSF